MSYEFTTFVEGNITRYRVYCSDCGLYQCAFRQNELDNFVNHVCKKTCLSPYDSQPTTIFCDKKQEVEMISYVKRGNRSANKAGTDDCVVRGKWHIITHGRKNCDCDFAGTLLLHRDPKCSIRMDTNSATAGNCNCGCGYIKTKSKHKPALPFVEVTLKASSPEDRLGYDDLYWKYVYAPSESATAYLEKMLSRVTLTEPQAQPFFSGWVSKPDPYAKNKTTEVVKSGVMFKIVSSTIGSAAILGPVVVVLMLLIWAVFQIII